MSNISQIVFGQKSLKESITKTIQQLTLLSGGKEGSLYKNTEAESYGKLLEDIAFLIQTSGGALNIKKAIDLATEIHKQMTINNQSTEVAAFSFNIKEKRNAEHSLHISERLLPDSNIQLKSAVQRLGNKLSLYISSSADLNSTDSISNLAELIEAEAKILYGLPYSKPNAVKRIFTAITRVFRKSKSSINLPQPIVDFNPTMYENYFINAAKYAFEMLRADKVYMNITQPLVSNKF